MRVLLDENIPVQLKRDLTGHEVVSLKDVGWQGIDNGALLRRVEGRYDVLLTADKNIYSQQTLRGRSFSILVVPTNRRRILVGYVPSILDALTRIRAGELVVRR
jgi:predicted nuclease of predicted toxin-antitoxin system